MYSNFFQNPLPALRFVKTRRICSQIEVESYPHMIIKRKKKISVYEESLLYSKMLIPTTSPSIRTTRDHDGDNMARPPLVNRTTNFNLRVEQNKNPEFLETKPKIQFQPWISFTGLKIWPK